MLISPLAARLCTARGVDPATLRGTGPRGRIMSADVLMAGSAPQRRGGTTLADFSTPPTRAQKDGYYVYDDEVDMSALADISMPIAVQCEKLLENRYSLFDYIIRAVVKACITCPSWQDPSGRIDVLLFEHKGEQITAICDAAHKSIYRIAKETASPSPVPENFAPHIVVCDAHTAREQVAAHLSADKRPGFAMLARGSTEKDGIRAGGDKQYKNTLSYTFYAASTLPEAEANRIAAALRAHLYNPIRLLLLS
ncbi:MAG: E3 binding domain-containing protein [Akkermansia sp.]|nr:E3 binding domain-containing protein [Akkermansia sp.]